MSEAQLRETRRRSNSTKSTKREKEQTTPFQEWLVVDLSPLLSSSFPNFLSSFFFDFCSCFNDFNDCFWEGKKGKGGEGSEK